MEDKIIYEYEHKDEIQREWFGKLINKIYSLSYPKPSIDFRTMNKVYPLLEKSVKETKYHYPCDFYYIPYNVYKILVDDFIDKYGIEFHWKTNMDFLLKILFEEGGIKEVYSTDEHNDKPYRHCVDVEVLEKYIPKEYSDKVKEIIEGYANTYRFGSRDYNDMLFSASMYAPSCNREAVVKAWKEVFGKDIVIPDDSAWIDEYEAADEEYSEYEDVTEENEEKNEDSLS